MNSQVNSSERLLKRTNKRARRGFSFYLLGVSGGQREMTGIKGIILCLLLASSLGEFNSTFVKNGL